MRLWTAFSWLSMGSNGGSCEHSNEFCSFLKDGKSPDQMSGYLLLKRYIAAMEFVRLSSSQYCNVPVPWYTRFNMRSLQIFGFKYVA
jgi:hypothetical protein